MRKEVFTWLVVVVFLLVFSITFVATQSQTQNAYLDEIEDAFQCLDGSVESTPSLSLEEAVFATLADVSSDKISATISSQKSASNNCWPSSGCRVKETAQVALAKMHIGEDAADIVDWIKNQSGAIQGLIRYLQIIVDNNLESECAIEYGSTQAVMNVGSDLELRGVPGPCLEITNGNFRLRIKDSCVDERFEVSCNSSFKTNLLYKEINDGTTFVSSVTHSASQNAWTMEEITAQCFKQGGTCNYEASLWATTALYTAGESTDDYAPYLEALAGGVNDKYFPSAFLFHILRDTSMADGLYGDILNKRPPGRLWRVGGSPHSEFYNTALGMLALGSGRGGADAPDLADGAVPDLFDEQSPSGCWGSIMDTAFVLYSSGWERTGGALGCAVEGGETNVDTTACCNGLTLNNLDVGTDGTCEGGLYGTCSTCGDNVCSNGENACTCAVDCTGDVEPDSCVGGYWRDGTSSTLTNTSAESGFCHLVDSSDGWPDGCCVTGYECEGEGEGSICEMVGGDPGPIPAPNTCVDGEWYGANKDAIDTTDVEGYCHLETDADDWPYGCCPIGYQCEYGEGNESESICERSGGGTPPSGGQTDCELAGNYCVVDGFSCIMAGGNPLTSLNCNNFQERCCTVDVPEETCFDKSGIVCGFEEDCSGSVVIASDGSCCTDTCEPRTGGDDDDDDGPTGCTSDSECADGKECVSGSCVSEEGGGTSLWIWIIFLIILIGLTAAGIAYKDKIRVLWFKMRGKAKTSKIRPGPLGTPGPVTRRAPPRFGPPRGMPPRRIGGPLHRRPIGKPMAAKPAGKVPNAKEKEMQETLNKLKEMSK